MVRKWWDSHHLSHHLRAHSHYASETGAGRKRRPVGRCPERCCVSCGIAPLTQQRSRGMNDFGLDEFQKLWALVGTLLVAGVQAAWFRITTRNDRATERANQLHDRRERDEREDGLRREDEKRAASNRDRQSIVRFLADSMMYVTRRREFLANPGVPGRKEASDASHEAANLAMQEVVLIPGSEFKAVAIETWNAVVAAAESNAGHPQDQERIANLARARGRFVDAARHHLGNL